MTVKDWRPKSNCDKEADGYKKNDPDTWRATPSAAASEWCLGVLVLFVSAHPPPPLLCYRPENKKKTHQHRVRAVRMCQATRARRAGEEQRQASPRRIFCARTSQPHIVPNPSTTSRRVGQNQKRWRSKATRCQGLFILSLSLFFFFCFFLLFTSFRSSSSLYSSCRRTWLLHRKLLSHARLCAR